MSYNAKNYTEQGGEITHIGGKLVIDEGGSVEGLPSGKMENQSASTSETLAGLVEDFNALLSKLKSAGLMEADEENEPIENQGSEPSNEEPNNNEAGGQEPDNTDPPATEPTNNPE